MGVPAAAIHGNKSQSARQKALRRFSTGNCRVLVATDIPARGLDIEGVTHVLWVANEPENYVHRIGELPARELVASLSHSAIRLNGYLRDIERLLKAAVNSG